MHLLVVTMINLFLICSYTIKKEKIDNNFVNLSTVIEAYNISSSINLCKYNLFKIYAFQIYRVQIIVTSYFLSYQFYFILLSFKYE